MDFFELGGESCSGLSRPSIVGFAMVLELCWRRRKRKAKRARAETPVAVRKLANADLGLSCVAPFLESCSGTDRTEAICAMHGSTPATPCPVMIACVYSPTPEPAT